MSRPNKPQPHVGVAAFYAAFFSSQVGANVPKLFVAVGGSQGGTCLHVARKVRPSPFRHFQTERDQFFLEMIRADFTWTLDLNSKSPLGQFTHLWQTDSIMEMRFIQKTALLALF